MYTIYIADPANFSATTVNNQTTFNTQLWLFDAEGKSVVFNNEAVGTNRNRSRIDNSTGCLTGRSAGIYYIADLEPRGQRTRRAVSRRHPRHFASRWLGRRD